MSLENSTARRQLAALRRQAAALEQLPAAVGAALQAFTAHLDALLSPPAPVSAPALSAPSPVPSLVDVSDSEPDTSELESCMIQSQSSTENYTEEIEDENDITAAEMERGEAPSVDSNSQSEASASSHSVMAQPSHKQQKVELLNKTWPWGDENKPVYKIADHYEPVYARCINKKVKWLEERICAEQLYTKKLKNAR